MENSSRRTCSPSELDEAPSHRPFKWPSHCVLPLYMGMMRPSSEDLTLGVYEVLALVVDAQGWRRPC